VRLPEQPGERIDRSQPIEFLFAGKRVSGFLGDTIGSALYASGQRVFSRSFKYHRPRGLACCSGHCANCQMTVDGIPSVRVCTAPLREGSVVKGQNYVGSLTHDLMQVTDKLGGPFTPPGFYYKTFIRPRKLWPLTTAPSRTGVTQTRTFGCPSTVIWQFAQCPEQHCRPRGRWYLKLREKTRCPDA